MLPDVRAACAPMRARRWLLPRRACAARSRRPRPADALQSYVRAAALDRARERRSAEPITAPLSAKSTARARTACSRACRASSTPRAGCSICSVDAVSGRAVAAWTCRAAAAELRRSAERRLLDARAHHGHDELVRSRRSKCELNPRIATALIRARRRAGRARDPDAARRRHQIAIQRRLDRVEHRPRTAADGDDLMLSRRGVIDPTLPCLRPSRASRAVHRVRPSDARLAARVSRASARPRADASWASRLAARAPAAAA